MARPRLPSDVQEMKGAFDKNPSRRRVDVATEAPLDPNTPPDDMNEAELKAWNWIVRTAPPRVLKNSDSLLVEMTARAVAHARDRSLTPPQRGAAFAGVKSMLSLMGMTPADRSRVESGWDGVPAPAANDQYAEFRRH